jgi:hypothetical protein
MNRFTAEVMGGQNYGAVYACLMMGGLARRPMWDANCFYKIEEGVGLVMLQRYEGCTAMTFAGEPSREEMDATDWLTVTPVEADRLLGAPAVEVGEAQLIVPAEVAAQQANDIMQDFPGTVGFPEALDAVLDGRAQARRADWEEGTVITLFYQPVTRDEAVCIVRRGVMGVFRPDCTDLVATDWEMVYPE